MDYAGVLRKYSALRERVWAILSSLRAEVLDSYELGWDGIDYEQGSYFFHRFQVGDTELSPGVKVSEEHIIKPVFWVTEATLRGASSETLGFKEDPEFKGYLIKELELGAEFFEKSSEEQEAVVLSFFRGILLELAEEGVIRPLRAPRYFTAG